MSQPVAISLFPYDLAYVLPIDWGRRGGNVVKRFVHDHGGHFASYEVPISCRTVSGAGLEIRVIRKRVLLVRYNNKIESNI